MSNRDSEIPVKVRRAKGKRKGGKADRGMIFTRKRSTELAANYGIGNVEPLREIHLEVLALEREYIHQRIKLSAPLGKFGFPVWSWIAARMTMTPRQVGAILKDADRILKSQARSGKIQDMT